LHELFGYVSKAMKRAKQNQTPHLWTFGQAGELRIARSGVRRVTATPLRPELIERLGDPVGATRLGAVFDLRDCLFGTDLGRALAAWEALRPTVDDYDIRVQEAAHAAIEAARPRLSSEQVEFGPADDPSYWQEVTILGPPLTQAATAHPDGKWIRAWLDDGVLRISASPGSARPQDGVVTIETPTGSMRLGVVVRAARGHRGGRPRRRPTAEAASPWGRLSRWFVRRKVWAVVAAIGLAGVVIAALALIRDDLDGVTLNEAELVVTAGGRMFVADTAETSQTLNTQLPGAGMLPTISHDRDRIAYLDSDNRPWIMNADGSGADQLFGAGDPCEFSRRPAWSADDESLATVCLDKNKADTGLYVVGLDGRGTRVEGAHDAAGAPTWVGNDRIVYMRAADDESTRTALWVIDRDGGVPERLTDPQTSTDKDPDWSAATGRVLFQRITEDGESEAWTVGVGEGAPAELRPGSGQFEVPTWSPDGTEIAYTVPVGDGKALRVMDVEGNSTRTLVTSPVLLGAPAWGSR
jgi:hypothetical protein